MGGFYEPESGFLIGKDLVVSELEEEFLIYFHDQMHIYWHKLSEGYYFEWTFNEVYKKHAEIITEMSKRGINHIFPINNLDEIPINYNPEIKLSSKKLVTLNEEKNYSIEKKIDGISLLISKKGNKVKIFSKEKKDITSEFVDLIEEIKKLSDKDFILEGIVSYDKDNNIHLAIVDIPYLESNQTKLSLSDRIKKLKELRFTETITEIDRKLSSNNKENLKRDIELISNLPDSKGVIIKNLLDNYKLGNDPRWKIYTKLLKN